MKIYQALMSAADNTFLLFRSKNDFGLSQTQNSSGEESLTDQVFVNVTINYLQQQFLILIYQQYFIQKYTENLCSGMTDGQGWEAALGLLQLT